MTFRIYELDDGAEVTCVVGNQRGDVALKLTARRNGKSVTAAVEGAPAGEWRVQLIGIKTLNRAADAMITKEPAGLIIQPAAGAREIRVELG
jgi:hypothetical protein